MRKGHTIGRWMPVEIEPLLSDPDLQTWHDDQKWWYLVLLFRAWQNVDYPCHLPNDSDKLRALASVPLRRSAQWRERSLEVLAKFVVSEDGQWLSHRKQLEVYATQLAKTEARSEAGRMGGLANSSKRVALLKQTTSKQSISKSHSNSLNPENFNSTEAAKGYCLKFLVSGLKNHDAVREAIEACLLRFPEQTAQRVAEMMIETRLNYLNTAGKEFTWPAVSFITSGTWQEPDSWKKERQTDRESSVGKAAQA